MPESRQWAFRNVGSPSIHGIFPIISRASRLENLLAQIQGSVNVLTAVSNTRFVLSSSTAAYPKLSCPLWSKDRNQGSVYLYHGGGPHGTNVKCCETHMLRILHGH